MRINITINKNVHERAKFFSAKEGKSLRENIEELLTQYYQQRIDTTVSEPIIEYNEPKSIQRSILETTLNLNLESQLQLLQFAEFLIYKNSQQQNNSIKGILKGMIYMSDDFDEPLEMFKEYMP